MLPILPRRTRPAKSLCFRLFMRHHRSC
jgi:hypothetical protein